MEIKGTINRIGSINEFGEKKFKKRNLVVTTDDTYPQVLKIEFHQDKCIELDRVKVGDFVVVHYNLQGKEWVNPEGKSIYFNTIQGWKINTTGDANQDDPAPQQKDNEPDDLPF